MFYKICSQRKADDSVETLVRLNEKWVQGGIHAHVWCIIDEMEIGYRPRLVEMDNMLNTHDIFVGEKHDTKWNAIHDGVFLLGMFVGNKYIQHFQFNLAEKARLF